MREEVKPRCPSISFKSTTSRYLCRARSSRRPSIFTAWCWVWRRFRNRKPPKRMAGGGTGTAPTNYISRSKEHRKLIERAHVTSVTLLQTWRKRRGRAREGGGGVYPVRDPFDGCG